MKKVFLFIIWLCPMWVMAQGFQVNLAGQKQIAMGHTGTGLKLDGASIFFNPGAVSMLDKNSISIGASPLFLKSTYVAPEPSTYTTHSNTISPPFQAYAVFGGKESKLKFGLGAYTPFGGRADWGSDWTGKYALQSLDLKAIFVQPTVSYKITDKLGIGVGFVYGFGSVNLQRALPLADANGKDGHAELEGHANGIGFNAGVYFQPIDKFSVGLSYRSQLNMKVKKGDATFTVPASLSTNFPNTPFTSTLALPSTATVGFGFYPTDKLTLAFDVNWVDWSVYDTLSFDYEKNTPTLQDTHSPRLYKSSFDFRLGGQYKVTDAFIVRAGVAYGTTPIKDGFVTPEVSDANRVEFTAGLGYQFSEHFSVDASFLYANIKKRTQTNNETKLGGTFKTVAYIPGIAVTYNF